MYKLLIVDDEYEIRNGLVKYFPWNKIGYQVVGQAENGKQAIDFIKNNHVDIMLCDIKLPFMSGIDVARELYNMKSKVKIVFLSAHREFEYAKKALAYGVKDYVVKSATYDELIDAFTFVKKELDNDRALKNATSGDATSGDAAREYRDTASGDGSCLAFQQASKNRPHLPSDANDEGIDEANINQEVFYAGINKKIINTVKDYVINNYKDANLEDAAALVYLSPHYLSKYFKQYTGVNFSDYLLMIRMNKAAELLKDIQYKTYEVSEMVGYSNSKNFTRAFKNYFGKTPREFRQGENLEQGNMDLD
ncbi:MAG TPA: response regulator [Clostridiales bacterium]|nr:response regulator [Clostridiales bacterium]